MKKVAWTVSAVLAAYVVLALGLDAVIGVTQLALEPGRAEGVLRTFDDEGMAHESRMIVIDDGETTWVQSGHHFRGWYHRLLRNPDVELVRGGEVLRYRAVPLDTPRAKAHMKELLIKRTGTFGYYAIRTVLLFAEVKPVRLDPR
ncbi:MAG: hypothetical protein ABFS46_08805 [Myxococcota bacterium]